VGEGVGCFPIGLKAGLDEVWHIDIVRRGIVIICKVDPRSPRTHRRELGYAAQGSFTKNSV
jgi:hypothetical protein